MAEISHEDPARRTVTIFGDCPVLCHAIAHLLQPGGYELHLVDTNREEPAPARSDVVLVTAGSHEPAHFAAEAPVLWLVDTLEEAEHLGEKAILWPCAAKELRVRVAARVLAGATPI